jgi:hypothetical protein
MAAPPASAFESETPSNPPTSSAAVVSTPTLENVDSDDEEQVLRPKSQDASAAAVHPRTPSSFVRAPAPLGHLYPPATSRGITPADEGESGEFEQKWEDGEADMVLELADGTGFEGVGFGAKDKSAGGECVFQTGESTHPVSRYYTAREDDESQTETRLPALCPKFSAMRSFSSYACYTVLFFRLA